MNDRFELDDEKEQIKIGNFFDEYEEYIRNEIIPKAVAKYLALAFSKDLLSSCPIINHINSAIDIFNLELDSKVILPEIENILNKEYNIVIIDYQKTKLDKLNKY